MSKKKLNNSEVQQTAAQSLPLMDGSKVRIANGAGRRPIIVDYIEGETFKQLFARTNVTPGENQIVTYGKKRVRCFDDLVEPGITVTIANTPNNG